MTLSINGETVQIDARTVLELVQFYGLSGKPIAVEVDGVIADKALWHETPIKDGAKIEIVHFVGGG